MVEVLTDCLLWTRGQGEFVTDDGTTHHLGDDTLEAIDSVRPTLELLVQSGDEPALPALADLIAALHDA
ncbi:hypothetical protein [Cellulomonas xiejunii]|uniref:Uncharacterized protein n=1 Tax=Cellulomonas xiejunii TaxID=2968083 RepID=A0ABY5KPA5_9CELL|nr:hypothetical protein [Cellulomonas xiejunii]MCC2322278.1 hypothetical protein [Cellulomonas xiejunii]UUI72332.1 hypothetical protein NP048_02355 [Cellulomonas xiejunii]